MKVEEVFIFQHLSFYEQLKFNAQHGKSACISFWIINNLISNQSVSKETINNTPNKQRKRSYTSVHVLLNLLNLLGKSEKMLGFKHFFRFYATSSISSIMHEHKYWLLFII